MEIVFRIYDHCLANGIEAIFGFSIGLLKRNEETLLGLKFDEILDFLNNKLLDQYKVIPYELVSLTQNSFLSRCKGQMGHSSNLPSMTLMDLSPMRYPSG